MRPSLLTRAAHKPLIQFVGPRANLWKDAPHHGGPHPLTPKNLEKHVAKAEPEVPKRTIQSSNGALEFSQLPARYRRMPISDVEMEAIESGGATAVF